MKTIPQITSAEPRIRIPACRSASPKNLKTRPLRMSPDTWPPNRVMAPRLATQSLTTVSQPTCGLGGISVPGRGFARARVLM